MGGEGRKRRQTYISIMERKEQSFPGSFCSYLFFLRLIAFFFLMLSCKSLFFSEDNEDCLRELELFSLKKKRMY